MEFFVDNIVFLGVQKRLSKRTGKQYSIVSLLAEDGDIYQCLLECSLPAGIKQLDKVDLLIKISSRFNNLSVKNMVKRG